MNQELLRIVDGIARDKNIEKEIVFDDLEQAMISAARKFYGNADDVDVKIDRSTGDITASRDGMPMSMKDLGRIAAQTAKQVMIQKIREAERGSIFQEFAERQGTIVTGVVSRVEGGAMNVTVGRAEAFLPRSEQIPGESHTPGERLRALILDVREAGNQVKIILSRSHPEFIRRLFELEVPEVSERVIEIRALAREAGYRTKIAVSSIDTKVDAVGACVGVRGSRIKNIVDELGGEKIDIVRWNESSTILISNALKPAEIAEIALCFELGRATVVVNEDQLSLAIGKRGLNVRLAARLTGWDVDILTPGEYQNNIDRMTRTLQNVGVDAASLDKLVALGITSVSDLEEVGVAPLIEHLELEEQLAEQIIEHATQEAQVVAVEQEAARHARMNEQASAAAQATPVGEASEDSSESAANESSASDAGDAPPADTSEPVSQDDAGDADAAAATDGVDDQAPQVGEDDESAEAPEQEEDVQEQKEQDVQEQDEQEHTV